MFTIQNENESIFFEANSIDKDGILYTTNDYDTKENSGFGWRRYNFKDFCIINDNLQKMIKREIRDFYISVYEEDGMFSFMLTVNNVKENYVFNMDYYIVNDRVSCDMVLPREKFEEYCTIYNRIIGKLKKEYEQLIEE